ncbi:hypothetical protein [Fructilactobacillus sanfranciscensis]
MLSIDETDDNQAIVRQLLYLFRNNWEGQSIRNVAVYCSKLTNNTGRSLDLFAKVDTQIKTSKLNQIIDEIHHKYGFSKLVFANSLDKGGTALERAKLVGGHNGGNSYE